MKTGTQLEIADRTHNGQSQINSLECSEKERNHWKLPKSIVSQLWLHVPLNILIMTELATMVTLALVNAPQVG